MIEKEILQALQERVTAAVAGVPSIDLPANAVKYLGRTFTIPNNHKWLEIVHIPNNIDDEFWGTEKTYRGIFRLILHWPLNDEGFYPPLTLLASIVAYFEKGTLLQNGSSIVRITDKPNLTGMLEEPPQALFPVSIQYTCFKQST